MKVEENIINGIFFNGNLLYSPCISPKRKKSLFFNLFEQFLNFFFRQSMVRVDEGLEGRSPVDDEVVPGDVSGLPRAQEVSDATDLLRLPNAGDRDALGKHALDVGEAGTKEELNKDECVLVAKWSRLPLKTMKQELKILCSCLVLHYLRKC